MFFLFEVFSSSSSLHNIKNLDGQQESEKNYNDLKKLIVVTLVYAQLLLFKFVSFFSFVSSLFALSDSCISGGDDDDDDDKQQRT